MFISRPTAIVSMLVVGMSYANAAPVSGYVSSFLIAQDNVKAGDLVIAESGLVSQSAIRLMLQDALSSAVTYQVHYELQPTISTANVGVFSEPGLVQSYRATDIDRVVNDASDVRIEQNLDRFSVNYASDHFDLTLGRQAISLGASRFINPTDTFVPFGLQTLNQEYRAGVDAARIQWYLNDLTLDAAVVVGSDFKGNNIGGYVSAKANTSLGDLSYSVVQIKDMSLYGVGFEGAIKEAGVWLEVGYSDWSSPDQQDYMRLSVGADYAFSSKLYLAAEYHYSGAFECSPSPYIACTNRPAFQRAGVNVLGEQYAIIAGNYSQSALSNWSVVAYANLSDRSSLISISNEISVTDNLYVSIGGQLNLGRGPILQATELAVPKLQSEFGAAASRLYANLRYYF